MAPNRRAKRKPATALDDDPILTEIDSDSELEHYRVRLPKGLPLDVHPPDLHGAADHPVEQECQKQLRNRYIDMDLFNQLPQQLESDYLRASALCRRGLQTMTFTAGTFYHAGSVGIRSNTKNLPWTSALLAHMVRACTHTPFTAVSLMCNVHMRTHRDKYNMKGTNNVLIPVSRFRQGQLWIEEESGPDLSPGGQHRGRNHQLKLPGIEFSPFDKHGTCPWKSNRTVLSAYTTYKAAEISSPDKRHLHPRI